MSSEAETQAAILRAYRGTRLALWRQNTGAVKIGSRFVRFGLKGAADLQGVLSPGGRAVYIEVKSARGRLRPEQEAFRRMVEKHGALWVLARSVDDVRKAVGE